MVRIGTWNLENLFLPGEASGAPDDRAAYDAKLDGLAAVIEELAPDVLAVQEVGDPEAMADLADRLAGEWRTALADPDVRGIRVGFLSLPEMTNAEQVRDFPERIGPVQVDDDHTTIHRLGRPALRVRVRAGGRSLDLVSAHLKSKLLTFPDGRFSPRDEDERTRYAVYALHPGPPRRPGCGPTRQRCSTRAPTCWSPATSTTSHRRPPPRSCSALRARRSAPAGSTGPTPATRSGSGTPPASWIPRSAGRGSTASGAS